MLVPWAQDPLLPQGFGIVESYNTDAVMLVAWAQGLLLTLTAPQWA